MTAPEGTVEGLRQHIVVIGADTTTVRLVDAAKAAVILGDDDVRAVRLALLIEEPAPGLRMVIER